MPNFSIPLSGLTADATALSAIANNLANQNTTGFKSVNVLFSDVFYQNFGTAGSGDPIQLGAGTQISALPGQFTQGTVQTTGVATDVAIQGGGFFVTQQNGVVSYTRDGTFSVNKDNFLVTSEGQQVLGFPAVNGVITPAQGLSPLQLGAGTISPPTATSSVQLTTNVDASAAVGDTFSTPLTIFDSLGTSHVLTFTFTKTGANAWNYTLSLPAGDFTPAAGAPPGQIAAGTLTFDGNGNLTAPTADIAGIAVPTLSDGANNLAFTWKLFNGTNSVLTQVAGPSSTSATQQDGGSSGALSNFNIGADGVISGSFSNGKTAALGQIALAGFADLQGLQRSGSNDFNETLASGQAVIGSPGSGGRGTLSGGGLELSNVDIATEFADLIVAQRAFEANAKAVTTFDQITQATINLKQ